MHFFFPSILIFYEGLEDLTKQ